MRRGWEGWVGVLTQCCPATHTSGMDLGSDLLFRVRLGFSGTPSDLLPPDLGRCEFEAGSEGKVLHTLASPEVVSVNMLGECGVL